MPVMRNVLRSCYSGRFLAEPVGDLSIRKGANELTEATEAKSSINTFTSVTLGRSTGPCP